MSAHTTPNKLYYPRKRTRAHLQGTNCTSVNWHPSCRKWLTDLLNKAPHLQRGPCLYAITTYQHLQSAPILYEAYQLPSTHYGVGKWSFDSHILACVLLLIWQNSIPSHLEGKNYLQTLHTAEMLPAVKFTGKASVMLKINLEEIL